MNNLKNLSVFSEYGKSINIIKQAGDNAISSIENIAYAIQGLSQKEAAAFLIKNQLRLGTKTLIQEQLAGLLVQKSLTIEKANEMSIEISSRVSKSVNVAATTTQTGANIGLTASIKSVATGLWAQATAWAATPMGQVTIAIGAIYALYKATDYLNKSYERQAEKLQKASDVYNQVKSDLEETKIELDSIREKLTN